MSEVSLQSLETSSPFTSSANILASMNKESDKSLPGKSKDRVAVELRPIPQKQIDAVVNKTEFTQNESYN